MGEDDENRRCAIFHLQDSVNDWTQAIERLPDNSIVKAVDRSDLLRTVKQINPNIKTVARHWYDGNQHFGGTVEDNRNRARRFFATWIDGTFQEQYAEHVNFVLEFNEWLASSHTGAELDDRLRWAEAVAWVWANEYRTRSDYQHIRLALLSVPVGNDIDVRFAEIAAEYDCVLSYHAYDKHLSGERDPGSWRWHCGRWHFMEQDWPQELRPEWIFGEAGPYSGVLGGWRDEKVLGGDREAYVEAVRRWIREIKSTPAYAEGRVLGFNLFTTARAGGVFDLYRTEQPELNMLAEMIAEEWTPVDRPPPPPEPDPPTPERVVDYVDALPTDTSSDHYPYDKRPLSAITDVIIHHSVGLPTNPPESINIGHHRRGWPRIGYHFYIMGDGTIYKVNHLTTHSFHAGGANRSSIGVCLAGDFTDAHPSPPQLESARYLLKWIDDVLGEKGLLKHRDVSATQCPGNTWAEWWDALTEAPQPRTWHKTVILLPQQTTRERYAAVADEAHGTRTEIAFSADAAFARPGNVGSHRVIVYDVEAWGGQEALEAWVSEHYGLPDVIEYREWPGEEPEPSFHFAAWPTDHKVVTQRFAANKSYYAQFGIPGGHEGLDIRAPIGSPVYAVYPGTVYRVDGESSAYGNQIRIEHPDGHKSVYGHLQEALVSIGDEVEAGQQIGRADNTGNIKSGASHLHLTIKKDGVQLSGFPAGIVNPTQWAEEHNPAWP